MSGGVDSSVAALLLKKKGYDVVGVFMRSYNIDGCEEGDAEDARRVAGKLGIPFYVWVFEGEYKKKVVDYMVDGYRRGLTPNPDVMCNKEIKFGLFMEKALKFGADYVATGHYVRIANSQSAIGYRGKNKKLNPSGYTLMAARDSAKDQSYFLWTLTQRQLKHCLFPIGDYQKPEVRKIAKKAGLPTAEKKDSQGICFLGRVTLADFLKDYIPVKKGAVLNIAGKVIGEHSGAQFYTIGQRHGLASGDWRRTPGVSKPFYVAEKNVRKNTIVVTEGEDSPELFKKEVLLTDMNFIYPTTNHKLPTTVFARVRYRQPLFKASLELAKGKLWKLVFDKPQKFVAAGQSAVFYVGHPSSPLAHSGRSSGELRMLGGGIILPS